MPSKFAGLLLAATIIAVPGFAQTTTELLQKGIFAQESEGNLDNAIMIYRQIVNSGPAQRDIAAQAQYRLAQTLLQKGDLVTASKEFERLARDYADQRSVVIALAKREGRRGYAIVHDGVKPGDVTVRIVDGEPSERQKQLAETVRRIEELEMKLTVARTYYTNNHPQVRSLEETIVKARQRMDELKREMANDK